MNKKKPKNKPKNMSINDVNYTYRVNILNDTEHDDQIDPNTKKRLQQESLEGDVEAMHTLATLYEEHRQYASALSYYREAALKGHVCAAFDVGLCYMYGLGSSNNIANPSHAFLWFQHAAAKGHAQAQCAVGFCFEQGYGIRKSTQEAVAWYRRAAIESNEACALFALARCYFEGILDVPQNFDSAFKLFALAAEQGCADAEFAIGMCHDFGYGVAKQDQMLAVAWYELAAKHNSKEAQYNLAVCFKYATGVEKNLAKALGWFRKAAQQGDQ
jgi:TPR repeat protein